jgi:hypothetical protein
MFPNKMPPCYELGSSVHLVPPPKDNMVEAVMPWKGLAQQSVLEYISVGEGRYERFFSTEVRAVEGAIMDEDGTPPIRFLIPRGKNWTSWDAAILLNTGKEVHVIFLQTALRPEYETRGVDMVKNGFLPMFSPNKLLRIQYHYILVLLTEGKAVLPTPKWWKALLDSKKQRKIPLGDLTIRKYVMYISIKELFRA